MPKSFDNDHRKKRMRQIVGFSLAINLLLVLLALLLLLLGVEVARYRQHSIGIEPQFRNQNKQAHSSW